MSLDFTQLLINTRNKTLDTLCCFLEHLRSNIVYMSIIVRQLVAHLVPSLATGWRKRRQQHTGFRKDREREREREWKGWGEGKHECRVSVQTRPCSLVPPSPSSSPSLVAFSPSSRGAREYESATPASLHNTYTGHRKRERERERERESPRTYTRPVHVLLSRACSLIPPRRDQTRFGFVCWEFLNFSRCLRDWRSVTIVVIVGPAENFNMYTFTNATVETVTIQLLLVHSIEPLSRR